MKPTVKAAIPIVQTSGQRMPVIIQTQQAGCGGKPFSLMKSLLNNNFYSQPRMPTSPSTTASICHPHLITVGPASSTGSATGTARNPVIIQLLFSPTNISSSG